MATRLTASSPDYFLQFAALLNDPVYRGKNIQEGHGEPVLLIPGFLAGDWTLRVMAGWLNRIGYRAYFSGIDWNVDCPNRTAEQLQWRLEHISAESDAPLIVIGHSLGGVLARFLGVNFPDKILHIITLGSPLSRPLRVHPLVLFASRMLQPLRRARGDVAPQCGSPSCACHFTQSIFSPLPPGVGFTSIFSKQDEVVEWQSCVQGDGKNREVTGRHMSLIVNPQVYRIIAETLAACCRKKEGDETERRAFS